MNTFGQQFQSVFGSNPISFRVELIKAVLLPGFTVAEDGGFKFQLVDKEGAVIFSNHSLFNLIEYCYNEKYLTVDGRHFFQDIAFIVRKDAPNGR